MPLEMTVVPLPTPVNVTPAVPEGLRLGKVVIKLAESTLLTLTVLIHAGRLDVGILGLVNETLPDGVTVTFMPV